MLPRESTGTAHPPIMPASRPDRLAEEATGRRRADTALFDGQEPAGS